MKQILDPVAQYRSSPVFTYGEDPQLEAEDLIRRKPLPKTPRAAYDDDSDGSLGIVSDGEEEFLFPAKGTADPAERKANALAELKKQRRNRHKDTDDDGVGLTEEEIRRRRRLRMEADLEKRNKIKSTEFVYDSDWDDEEDRFVFREGGSEKGGAEE